MLRHALDGLTVLDFTQIVAGPACTMLLADMGADVLKVESPAGDLGRKLGPAWIGEDSAIYHAFNRNKRSLCIDLKSPEGAEAARRLASKADVVIESMRPGVMERLGLGPARLMAADPRLIYCSVSAYGQAGPFSAHAGVDGIMQADSGLMSIIGTPGAEPMKVQAPIVDVFTGHVAAMAILAKLMQRMRDGQGGHLDVNLFNAALTLQQASLSSYLADGVLPEKIGSAAPYSAPNEAFETADGWIMIAAYIGDRWPRLCGVLGCEDLADDPRLATSPQRVRNRAEMRRSLAPYFAARTTAEWIPALAAADILCAPVADYASLGRHPQLAANRILARWPGPDGTIIEAPGFAVDSRACNALPHRPAPRQGADSRAALTDAGYSDREIERLAAAGIVRVAPQTVTARTSAIL